MGLMWTPSILYDLCGERYLIWVPSMNVIELICSCSMVWFLWLRGFPWAHSDPVASHLEVSWCVDGLFEVGFGLRWGEWVVEESRFQQWCVFFCGRLRTIVAACMVGSWGTLGRIY